MQKLYDAVVKTGEYVDDQGNTKGRYENVGSVMQGDNGMFLILKRTFNPAGLPNPENKDSAIVSFFEPNNNNQQQPQSQHQYGQQPAPQQGGFSPQQQGGSQQQAPQGGFAPNQRNY